MYYGLTTQHRAPTRPQPRMTWTLSAPRGGITIRWR
jgi:hypothetical protein